jgi:dTDP-4-amino-4,6-dideoxygalactose transaminase
MTQNWPVGCGDCDLGGYSHQEMGFNSRLDALQAAVLRVKLAHLEDWSEARRANADLYRELFADYDLLDAVTLPVEMPDRRHIYNQFTLRVHDGRRNELQQSMRQAGIGAMVYYPTPLHLQTCFQGLGYSVGQMPESERAAAEVLSLPIFAEVTAAQQEQVVQGIASALGRSIIPKRSIVSFEMPAKKAA